MKTNNTLGDKWRETFNDTSVLTWLEEIMLIRQFGGWSSPADVLCKLCHLSFDDHERVKCPNPQFKAKHE